MVLRNRIDRIIHKTLNIIIVILLLILILVCVLHPGTSKSCGDYTKEELIKDLLHGNTDKRSWAAYCLAHVGPDAKETVPLLIEALDDKSVKVRTYAALSIALLDPDAREAIPKIHKLLNERDESARSHAIWALWWMGPPYGDEAAPIFNRALEDEYEDVRYYARLILASMGGESGIEVLINMLSEDEDNSLRIGTARTLGKMGAQAAKALPELYKLAESDEESWLKSYFLDAIEMIEADLDAIQEEKNPVD